MRIAYTICVTSRHYFLVVSVAFCAVSFCEELRRYRWRWGGGTLVVVLQDLFRYRSTLPREVLAIVSPVLTMVLLRRWWSSYMSRRSTTWYSCVILYNLILLHFSGWHACCSGFALKGKSKIIHLDIREGQQWIYSGFKRDGFTRKVALTNYPSVFQLSLL